MNQLAGGMALSLLVYKEQVLAAGFLEQRIFSFFLHNIHQIELSPPLGLLCCPHAGLCLFELCLLLRVDFFVTTTARKNQHWVLDVK